jgi:hypothetical protein
MISHMPAAQRYEDALEALFTEIENGAEFPDAVFRVTQKFNVSSEELGAWYDEACANGHEQ